MLELRLIFLNKDIIKSRLETSDAIVVCACFILALVFINKNKLQFIAASICLFRSYTRTCEFELYKNKILFKNKPTASL
jgi:hypothetical protein